MSTKALAVRLGLVEKIRVNEENIAEYNTQTFDFLYVLDFEATCWATHDSNRRPPEIIEFSVVLYDVKQNRIVSEFQQYVMPTEVPILSEFCKGFLGISQSEVDNGVPLGTCLMLHTKWVNEQSKKYHLAFGNGGDDKENAKRCTFVTWTDWDLGVCLTNECKRKRLRKSSIFCEWIDLKAVYMNHYNRKPKGLRGALSEVGLLFEGNEHCGLHDARNTARLAGKMISDGIALRITNGT